MTTTTERIDFTDSVTHAREGDIEAFEFLYNASSRIIRAECMKYFRSQDDVEDAMQEIYLQIYRKLDTLSDPRTFIGWARTISRNTCINMIAKRDRTQGLDDLKPGVIDDSLEGVSDIGALEEERPYYLPDETIESQSVQDIVLTLLNELPELQRACIVLWNNGNTYREIGEELGIPEGTAKSNVNYAKKKLVKATEKLEKEQGIKLHSLAPFTFFLWMLSLYDKLVEIGNPLPGGPSTFEAIREKITSDTVKGIPRASGAVSSTGTVTKMGLIGGLSAKAVGGIAAGIAIAGLAVGVAIGSRGSSSSANNAESEIVSEAETASEVIEETQAPDSSDTASDAAALAEPEFDYDVNNYIGLTFDEIESRFMEAGNNEQVTANQTDSGLDISWDNISVLFENNDSDTGTADQVTLQALQISSENAEIFSVDGVKLNDTADNANSTLSNNGYAFVSEQNLDSGASEQTFSNGENSIIIRTDETNSVVTKIVYFTGSTSLESTENTESENATVQPITTDHVSDFENIMRCAISGYGDRYYAEGSDEDKNFTLATALWWYIYSVDYSNTTITKEEANDFLYSAFYGYDGSFEGSGSFITSDGTNFTASKGDGDDIVIDFEEPSIDVTANTILIRATKSDFDRTRVLGTYTVTLGLPAEYGLADKTTQPYVILSIVEGDAAGPIPTQDTQTASNPESGVISDQSSGETQPISYTYDYDNGVSSITYQTMFGVNLEPLYAFTEVIPGENSYKLFALAHAASEYKLPLLMAISPDVVNGKIREIDINGQALHVNVSDHLVQSCEYNGLSYSVAYDGNQNPISIVRSDGATLDIVWDGNKVVEFTDSLVMGSSSIIYDGDRIFGANNETESSIVAFSYDESGQFTGMNGQYRRWSESLSFGFNNSKIHIFVYETESGRGTISYAILWQ